MLCSFQISTIKILKIPITERQSITSKVEHGTLCANDERPRVCAMLYSCGDGAIRWRYLKIQVRFVPQISLGLQNF